jgi:ribonuclease HIII
MIIFTSKLRDFMLIEIKTKALSKIQQISSQLAGQGFKSSKIEEKQYNFEIKVSNTKDKIKVLVYFGKKGVNTIIQGNPTSETYKDVKAIVEGEDLFYQFNQELDEPDNYIGTDESGKGDFFGPLVIAGVYVDRILIQELRKIGVRDSKQLNHIEIENISKNIRKIIPEKNRSVVSINPEKYNQLYESFKNLNKLLAWGHIKTIENIFLNNQTSTIITDKFANESLMISELYKKRTDVSLTQTTNAERYTAVAAASILARDKMVKWFIKLSNELRISIPKGAGSVVNITAKKIADEFGPEMLPKLVKLHFKNFVNLYEN